MVHEITDDNFQEEIGNSPIPCIIGFTAGFCTMCDELAPIFESLSDQFGDDAKFCLVNTDSQANLRTTFAVACWPYIVLVKDGMRIPLFDESVTEERLAERIRYVLEGGKAPTFPIKFRRH